MIGAELCAKAEPILSWLISNLPRVPAVADVPAAISPFNRPFTDSTVVALVIVTLPPVAAKSLRLVSAAVKSPESKTLPPEFDSL